MMQTQSTGAGRFASFDLSRVPSPCFVVDEVKLRENLELLKAVSHASGAEILLALKAFPCGHWRRSYQNIWPAHAHQAYGRPSWRGRIMAAA